MDRCAGVFGHEAEMCFFVGWIGDPQNAEFVFYRFLLGQFVDGL